jgi:hypothetical protein
MTTLREQYLDAIVAQIKLIPGLAAVVDRSLSSAFSTDDDDVIVIHRGKEDVDNDMYPVADRSLEVKVSIVTRNAVPERIADALIEQVHPRLIAFSPAGVTDVAEIGSDEPKYGGADGQTCMLTTRYRLLYRTQANSLTN